MYKFKNHVQAMRIVIYEHGYIRGDYHWYEELEDCEDRTSDNYLLIDGDEDYMKDLWGAYKEIYGITIEDIKRLVNV